MTITVVVKVTPQGLLVPHSLIAAWGNIKEVEIEQQPNAIIIKPKAKDLSQLRTQITNEMRAAGLIEDLPWEQPPVVPAEVRARLAKKLSHGKPLSEIIIEDRE